MSRWTKCKQIPEPLPCPFPFKWTREAQKVSHTVTQRLRDLHEGLCEKIPPGLDKQELKVWITWVEDSLEKAAQILEKENAENWNNLFFQEERRKEMQRREEAKAGIEALKREEEERQREWNKRNPWTKPTERTEK